MTDPTPPPPWPLPPGRDTGPHPEPKRRHWLLPTLTGAGGLLLGAALAAAGTGGQAATSTPADDPTTTTTATATVTSTQAADRATAPTVTQTITAKPTITRTVRVTPAPTAAFPDGVYLVGTDIKPGRYRTVHDVAGTGCYWEVDASPDHPDDIVANDNPTGGRPTVNLRAGQQFETQDCGSWTRA